MAETNEPPRDAPAEARPTQSFSWRSPGFAPDVERLYAVETGAARVRAMRTGAIMMALAGVALARVLWDLLPDAHGVVWRAWLAAVAPCAALTLLAVGVRPIWSRIGAAWLQAPLAANGIVMAVFLAAMAHAGGARGTPTLFAGMAVILLMGPVCGEFAAWVGAAYALAVWAVFAVAAWRQPELAAGQAAILTLAMGVIGVCACVLQRRLELATRRAFAAEQPRPMATPRPQASGQFELDVLALRDKLTGLAHRSTFDKWLGAAWLSAARTGMPLGLVIMQIDSLVSYVEFYGVAAADTCLQAVGTTLREQLRDTTDLLARIGDSTFAVILPDIGPRTSSDIGERLRVAIAAMERPHFGAGTDRVLSLSVGVASLLPDDATSERDLLAAAEQALAAARRGGNQVFLAANEGDRAEALKLRRLGVPE